MSLLDEVIARAAEPGASYVPSKLLSELEETSEPLRALAYWDRVNALGKDLDEEFMFIRIARLGVAGRLPTEEESGRWSSLIRWLVQSLVGYTRKSDPQGCVLAAVFIVAATVDYEDALWGSLPRECFQSAELEKAAEAIVKSVEVNLDAPLATRQPISTKEFLETFKKAIAEQDWVEIAESMHGFEHYVAPTPSLKQASKLLLQFGANKLATALSNVASPVLAKMAVMALSEQEAYSVAAASGNPFMQFAALREWSSQRDQINTQVSAVLVTLLQQLSSESMRWSAFMAEFNRYPVRYPRLQQALGVALSTASKEALEAYVASIILHEVQPADDGRTCISDCLEIFRAEATVEQRRLLWSLAHKRWNDWGFVGLDANGHMAVSHSFLDYAIVGYALECLDAPERQAEEARLTKALANTDFEWRRDQTHMTTAINRILSIVQPFRHAGRMSLGVSWRYFDKLAPDFTQTEYYKLRHHT